MYTISYSIIEIRKMNIKEYINTHTYVKHVFIRRMF